MRQSVKKSLRMYNDLATTTRKISLSTYYRYKPKNVKLQGKIPFRQSCCEKCQNAENIIDEAGKYMRNVPHDLGGCVDRTLCPYKIAKRNIRKGDLIFVHDFSQNYLCFHQNECQGLHWKHAQKLQ